MAKVIQPSSRKVVLGTGSPGNGRDDYLTRVTSLANQSGKATQILSLFDYIQRIGKAKGVDITRENVLDFYLHNPDRMNQFRDMAFEEVATRIKNSTDTCLVSTPSVFEWGGASMFGFDKEHIELLQPDFIVVIVDDFVRVKKRLQGDPEWRDKEFSLEMIAKWRRSGIDRVWQIAHEFSPPIPSYIIALEHDPQVLFDLLFTNKKKVYLSFPITRKTLGLLSKVFDFAERLSKYYVVFNPLTIYDWNIVRKWKKVVDEANKGGNPIPTRFTCVIPYRDGKRKYTCDSAEVERIVVDARHQIVSRDYKMIGSADYVIVYHPTEDISAGVMCEMVHGRREVKKVYAYYPFEPSPWFEYYADKIERNERRFFKILKSLSGIQ